MEHAVVETEPHRKEPSAEWGDVVPDAAQGRKSGWRGPMAVFALFGLSIAGYALVFAAIDSVTKHTLQGVF